MSHLVARKKHFCTRMKYPRMRTCKPDLIMQNDRHANYMIISHILFFRISAYLKIDHEWKEESCVSSGTQYIILPLYRCRANNIWSPNDNFKLRTTQSSSTVFVHETGAASAWQYDTTEFVHFKAIYGFCYLTSTGECSNVRLNL